MLRALIKVFATVFVALPVKMVFVFLKVGVAMFTTFFKLITLPIRIIF